MKKRVLSILLTLFAAINLTACGTQEREPVKEVTEVLENTEPESEQNTEDRSAPGITEADMEQLYELAYVLSNYAPAKEECKDALIEDWVDYLILTDSITNLDVDLDYNVTKLSEEQLLKEMNLKELPDSMSAYRAMWVLKNVLHIESYTMADLNAIYIQDDDCFARYYRGKVYKQWEDKPDIENAFEDDNIAVLMQDEKQAILRIEVEDGKYYVMASLIIEDDLRYWSFDYWGKKENGSTEIDLVKGKDNSENKWIQAYRELLLSYEENSQGEGRFDYKPEFNLVYIDEDEIPELIIIDGSDKVNVYTYYEGKAVYVGQYGQYGAFSFLPKGNMILSDYIGADPNHQDYYAIQNGTSIKVEPLDYDGIADILEGITEHIDDAEVSQAVYEAQMQLNEIYEMGDAFLIMEYGDSTYEISEEMFEIVFCTGAEKEEGISYESWQEAYEDFLLSYQPEHVGSASKEEPHFNLAYVDEDDIPELIIIDGLSHSHGGNVYTCYEGKVVYIGMYGQYGGFTYMDQENIISNFYDAAGVEHSGFYKIADGAETEMAFFSTRWPAFEDEESSTGEVSKTYYIDGKEATKAEYDKQRNLYPEYGAFTSIIYHDSYPIDESTIRSVFDMER